MPEDFSVIPPDNLMRKWRIGATRLMGGDGSTYVDSDAVARAAATWGWQERERTTLPTAPPIFDEPAGEARKSAESANKTRWDLVPSAAVAEIAEVLAFGAKKYSANNWCRGAAWHRYFRALIDHCFHWWRGQDRDPETGLSHLAHAGCCLLFLMEYQRNGWGTDDRFRGPDAEKFIKHDGAGEDPPREQVKAHYPTSPQMETQVAPPAGAPHYPANTTWEDRLAICIEHELTYGGSAKACAAAIVRDMHESWIVPPFNLSFGRRPR
jgi:hypothetical protein